MRSDACNLEILVLAARERTKLNLKQCRLWFELILSVRGLDIRISLPYFIEFHFFSSLAGVSETLFVFILPSVEAKINLKHSGICCHCLIYTRTGRFWFAEVVQFEYHLCFQAMVIFCSTKKRLFVQDAFHIYCFVMSIKNVTNLVAQAVPVALRWFRSGIDHPLALSWCRVRPDRLCRPAMRK